MAAHYLAKAHYEARLGLRAARRALLWAAFPLARVFPLLFALRAWLE